MKLIIYTQHEENYGAHDWDGVGKCPQYWKPKGGTTYVVRDINPNNAVRIAKDGIPTITAMLTEVSEGFRQSVIGWCLVDNDVQECEEWETPVVLYYDPTYREWKALCETKNDEHGYMNRAILKKTERWTLVNGGARKDYKCQYKLSTGELVDSENLDAALKCMAVAA